MDMTNIKNHMGMLGLRVKDRVTGYKGVISSISFDLYGCVQAAVTPPVSKEGKVEGGRWFDVARLEITNKKPVMAVPNFERGPQAEGRQGAAEKPAISKY